MIGNLLIIHSQSNNPYKNLAIEEYLFENLQKDTFVIYLWKNDKTVVIGKNQNALAECNLEAIKKNSIFIARRTTGGGAVYHDKNNLNFSFITNNDDYDLNRQFKIIIEAVNRLGIKADISGRNDIQTKDGYKFSGNAFLNQKDKSMHHGTILVDANMSNLAKYLNVNKLKLQSKGVKSVKSRVCNLTHFNSLLTVNVVEEKIIQSAIDILKPLEVSTKYIIDDDKLNLIIDRISDEKYILGSKIKYNLEVEEKFDWGLCTINAQIEKNVIKDIKIYTDSLNTDIDVLAKSMIGKNIYEDDFDSTIQNDVINLIKYGGKNV